MNIRKFERIWFVTWVIAMLILLILINIVSSNPSLLGRVSVVAFLLMFLFQMTNVILVSLYVEVQEDTESLTESKKVNK